jgi:hypothetical protein
MPVRIQVPNPPPSLSDLELVYGRPVVDTFMQTNEYIGSDCFATIEAFNPTGDEIARQGLRLFSGFRCSYFVRCGWSVTA